MGNQILKMVIYFIRGGYYRIPVLRSFNSRAHDSINDLDIPTEIGVSIVVITNVNSSFTFIF